MSVVAVPPLKTDWALPPYPVHRITVHEFHQMIAAGIFDERDQFELIEGYLVPKYGHKNGAPIPVYQIPVAKYHEMIEAGIYDENSDLELIDGFLVQKVSKNPPHDGHVQNIEKKILRRLPTGWDTRVQSAITLSIGEPEPDIAVVRGDETSYLRRHPTSNEIGMLVEVAESSLDLDRKFKGPAYARDEIPIYWIVNLVDNIIEVYTQPSAPTDAPAYASRQDFARSDAIPLVLDGVVIASFPVSDLLP